MSFRSRLNTGVILIGSLFFSSMVFAEPNCSGAPDRTSYYNFKTACFKHDVCYSEHPLTGFTKKQCDEMFFQNMMASCRGRGWLCTGAAALYFGVVDAADKSSFMTAGKKGHRTADLIEAANDMTAFNIVKARTKAQKKWMAKNRACAYTKGDSAYKKCIAQLDAIVVPDIPFVYHLGRCNMFGIDWASGHRTANAKMLAKATGVPREQIEDKESKDPCIPLY